MDNVPIVCVQISTVFGQLEAHVHSTVTKGSTQLYKDIHTIQAGP